MKKLLLSIIILLAMAGQGWGESYYAQANCEITACEWDTVPAGGGSDLTWASLANGDALYANGKTITIANDVGSGSVTVTLATTAGPAPGTAGGTFTYDAAAVSGKVLYTNLLAGAEHCLQISGAAGAGKVIEIIGTITGSSTTNSKHGVYDTHTGATSYIVATGAKTAGTNLSASGYYSSSTSGYHTLTGTATSNSTGYGLSINTSTSGSTQSGDCIGSSEQPGGSGCICNNATSPLTITGNIINAKGFGASGNIIWTPTAPSSGVNGHYVKFDGGGTPVYLGKNTETQSKAMTDFYYFISSSATSQAGTGTSGGGGGAWGF